MVINAVQTVIRNDSEYCSNSQFFLFTGHLVISPQRIRNITECYQLMDNQDGGETSILKALLSEPVSGDETDDQEDPEEYPLPECAVLLEDCKSFLQSNPCFCKECEILFPTDNDFDAHKMISHSFLVAVTKNKAVKSTSKSFDSPANCNLLCNHCNVVFPNTIALLHHTYNLLPGKFACDKCDMVFESDTACKQHRVSHFGETSLMAGQKYIICKVCTCHFKYSTRYKAHLKESHCIDETGVMQEVCSDLQCPLCPNSSEHVFLNNTAYNKHITRSHSSYYRKKCIDSENIVDKPQFKCPKCNMFFSSNYSVRIHLTAKHGYVGRLENSKQLPSLNSESSKTVIPNKFNFPQVPSSRKTWPLSKSTLFKCNKCQVHFVSCISATIHSNQCRTKKEFFQCTQCNRSIKLQDKLYHTFQHKVSNKFKVIVVSRNILNRILCKCTTCNICFDERSFITHHTNVCDGETPSIHCKDCKIWIHTKAMPLHKKLHASVASKEFIIVDYVYAETSVKESETNAAENNESEDTEVKTVMDSENSKAKTKFINKIRRNDTHAYFYCPTCKCNMKVKRGLHHIGKCNPKKPITTCKLCGLRFTDKGLKTHQALHGEFPKLKLKDLTFVNIQTGRVINAPFPKFKKCKFCDVTFYSYIALRSHTCFEEDAKSCKYCREKFSDAAYKLHVPYHEYTMPSKKPNAIASKSKINENDELIKKYQSLKQVWNILFLCQTCDIVMDDYDRAVEHCQDHFCNMQSYNVTIEHCDTCDLNFVDDCYEKHKELHVNNHINKESFKLIEYTYENLLLDSWMDIFRSLTKEQIDLILSKSIYRFTRSVRMKVVTNGPTNLMLYQCGVCQVIVACDKVNEHAQNINGICEGSRKFPCSHCTLTFALKRQREIHEKLHQVIKLNAASFRIVQFYAEKQFSATVVRKNDKKDNMDSHSLKFIRCQHCGKLINKYKYKMHTKNHVYYATYKTKMLLKSKSKSIQRVKKVALRFYVCKSCNLCVSSRYYKVHACKANVPTEKCTQCSLLFRAKVIAFHYEFHKKHSFNSSKINVTFFQNGTILRDSDNVKAQSVQKEEKWVGNKNIHKLPHSKLRHKMQAGGRSTLRVKIQNKVMVVYHCAKCNICIWHKHNVPRHTCVSVRRQVKCDICGLIEHTSRKIAHSRLHELRQFDAGDLKYIKFHPRASPASNSPVNKDLAQKRKTLAACEGTDVKRRRFNTNINEINDEGSNDDSYSASKINQDSNMDEDGKGNKDIPVNKPKVGIARKKEIPFEKSRLFTDYINNRYYKCKNCKLLFVTCTGLVQHEEVCGENGETVNNNEAIRCNDCGLAFHASMIMQHKQLQNCKIHLAERVSLVTIKQKGKSHDNHKNWLYVCPPCDIYTFSLKGIRQHFQNKHQAKSSLITCTDCGLTFSCVSFNRHAKLYHRGEFGISDLYIAAVEDTNLEDALKDSPNDKDVVYVDDERYKLQSANNKTPNSTLDEESNSIIDDNLNNDSVTDGNPIIYSCNICHLSFITAGTLASHHKRGIHNIRRLRCDLCGLNFTAKSLDIHMRLHHTGQEINNKKKTGVNNTTVDSVSSSFDDESQNDTSIEEDTIATSKLNDTLEIESVSEENIDNGNSKDIIVKSNPNDELERANVFRTSENAINNDTVNKSRDDNSGTSDFIPVSKNINIGDSIPDRSSNSNEIKTNTVPNTLNIELNKNKLYKCSQCDVYYLTADDCREHTDRHTQLDPTEYIACKICDLQFCCEYLGRHMKSHREKTFCIDDLIVAEYRIEHGDVRVDTYLAVDRLKTKLVTTTTDFDTVDSTTVEGS